MTPNPNTGNDDPHAFETIRSAGPTPEDARAAIIMLHGRGASAEDILSLHGELGVANLVAVAPHAYGHTWYPQSFLAPLKANQPYLDSALKRVRTIVDDLNSRGIPTDRIALLGFSQGACLALEYVARHPQRFGAVLGLTGGLIGPPSTPRNYPGTLSGTPVLLGSGDPDPHVPFERVRETESVLTKMGAQVDIRRYPGLPHTINQDELDACRTLLQRIVDEHPKGKT